MVQISNCFIMLSDTVGLTFGQATTRWLVFVPSGRDRAEPQPGVTHIAGGWKISIQRGFFMHLSSPLARGAGRLGSAGTGHQSTSVPLSLMVSV